MPAIHFQEVSFSYTSAKVVFERVSAHIGDGWTGIVGGNGAGKSTLLSLVAGGLTPDSGEVVLDPGGAIVSRCPQEVDEVTAEIRSFSRALDGFSRQWMGRLRIDPESLHRWASLSPGERKRWQLGAALASEPDILLLDEPTNHLDSDGRETVEAALGRFDGVGLLISHDRGFLDRLTSRTLRVGGGALRLWSGPYSVARRAWTAEEASRLEELEAVQRKERALRKRLARERRSAGEKDQGFSSRVRRAGPRDHDATSMAAKGRHESGSVSGQRRRTVVRSALERAEEQASELSPPKTLDSSIFFDFEPCRKRRLLRYAGPLRAGSSELATYVDVAVEREDRVRLQGPNGSGKTTLLRALVAGARIPPDRLLYLPQELTREDGVALLARVSDLSKERRGRVLNVVAALGVDPDELVMSERPSPGETRKLAMALGLGTGAWVLLLDEPTNHLDLPSIERIESALENYPGAMVLVTHDETFGARTTETVWTLASGSITIGS